MDEFGGFVQGVAQPEPPKRHREPGDPLLESRDPPTSDELLRLTPQFAGTPVDHEHDFQPIGKCIGAKYVEGRGMHVVLGIYKEHDALYREACAGKYGLSTTLMNRVESKTGRVIRQPHSVTLTRGPRHQGTWIYSHASARGDATASSGVYKMPFSEVEYTREQPQIVMASTEADATAMTTAAVVKDAGLTQVMQEVNAGQMPATTESAVQPVPQAVTLPPQQQVVNEEKDQEQQIQQVVQQQEGLLDQYRAQLEKATAEVKAMREEKQKMEQERVQAAKRRKLEADSATQAQQMAQNNQIAMTDVPEVAKQLQTVLDPTTSAEDRLMATQNVTAVTASYLSGMTRTQTTQQVVQQQQFLQQYSGRNQDHAAFLGHTNQLFQTSPGESRAMDSALAAEASSATTSSTTSSTTTSSSAGAPVPVMASQNADVNNGRRGLSAEKRAYLLALASGDYEASTLDRALSRTFSVNGRHGASNTTRRPRT